MLGIRVVRRVARVFESPALVALTTSIVVHAVVIALLVTVVSFVAPKNEASLVIDLRSWTRGDVPLDASAPQVARATTPRPSPTPAPMPPARALTRSPASSPPAPTPPPPPVTAAEPAPTSAPPPAESMEPETAGPEDETAVADATPDAPAAPGPVTEAPQPAPPSVEPRVAEALPAEPSTPAAPDGRVAEPIPKPATPEVPPPDVRALAAKAFVAARAEGSPFRARREVLEYLLDHPEFATHLTRMLRLARYRVWEASDGLNLDDGWGARLKFSVAASEGGLRVIHASGHYDPGLLPTIRGELIVLLAPTFTSEPDGHDVVSLAVTTFVKFKSPVVEFVAKMARAAVAHKAEREARTLGRVIARLSRAIDEDPAGLYQKLSDQPDVPRRELREFGALLGLP